MTVRKAKTANALVWAAITLVSALLGQSGMMLLILVAGWLVTNNLFAGADCPPDSTSESVSL